MDVVTPTHTLTLNARTSQYITVLPYSSNLIPIDHWFTGWKFPKCGDLSTPSNDGEGLEKRMH